MLFQHNVFFQRKRAELERARARHLEVVKGALLNEHYLEHEARLAHLARHVSAGQPLVPDTPPRPGPQRAGRRYAGCSASARGPAGPDDDAAAVVPARTPRWAGPGSTTSSAASTRCAPTACPATSSSAAPAAAAAPSSCAATSTPTRSPTGAVWVADQLPCHAGPGRQAPELPEARGGRLPRPISTSSATASPASTCSTTGSASCRARSPTRCPAPGSSTVALLRIGRTAAGEVARRPRALYDRLAPGGVVVVDVERGAPAPRSRRSAPSAASTHPLERVDASAVCWRGPSGRRGRPAVETLAERTRPSRHPPLARPAPQDAVDLSVVVVFYNMRREADAHPALAVPRATRRASTTSTTRSSSSRTAPTPTSASARTSSRLRARVPLPRPRRRRRRRRR